jgi:hypothetical protein
MTLAEADALVSFFVYRVRVTFGESDAEVYACWVRVRVALLAGIYIGQVAVVLEELFQS